MIAKLVYSKPKDIMKLVIGSAQFGSAMESTWSFS